MKPKRPTETDLLALVQNGFNAQRPKDRAAQASAPGPEPKPKANDSATTDPSPLVPMVRITLTVPEELRYRLKLTLMNQGRTVRNKMTQDEFGLIPPAPVPTSGIEPTRSAIPFSSHAPSLFKATPIGEPQCLTSRNSAGTPPPGSRKPEPPARPWPQNPSRLGSRQPLRLSAWRPSGCRCPQSATPPPPSPMG
jgi:hypothetical protein